MWSGRNAAKEEMQRVCLCVCAVSSWMYSRSDCLSELRPDRCGSNLRQYDVIEHLIFWDPAHRPPLSGTYTCLRTNTRTHTHRLIDLDEMKQERIGFARHKAGRCNHKTEKVITKQNNLHCDAVYVCFFF